MRTICFVGVEGVGKSWTTKFVSNYFQTHFAIEYGDFYCKHVLKGYFRDGTFLTTKADFKKIVLQQRQIWAETIAKSHKKQFCFFDTDHVYTKYFAHKQFGNWDWIDQYIQNQPIDLFIFLKSEQTVVKKNNLITAQTVQKETDVLLKHYQAWVPAHKLIVIDCNHYQKRQSLVVATIKKYLHQNNVLTDVSS